MLSLLQHADRCGAQCELRIIMNEYVTQAEASLDTQNAP
jgi:hypothetical protein